MQDKDAMLEPILDALADIAVRALVTTAGQVTSTRCRIRRT